MQLLDVTLATVEENVALDEALLEAADLDETPAEIFRLWESPSVAVVIGRSSRASEEVDLQFCSQRGIPVIRRCSGGAAVVLGPGCLMYSVILSYHLRPQLRLIDEVHRFVLGRIANSLKAAGIAVEHQGISDLTFQGQKISGNSLRCKRHAVLYHGTLLYDYPLSLLASCLRTAPRQPPYRAGRDHLEFVVNLPVPRANLIEALHRAWPTTDRLPAWPEEQTSKLVAERYSLADWNLRL